MKRKNTRNPGPSIGGRGGSTPSKGKRKRRTLSFLSRKTIVKAALKIVDREGLASLSMRKLGAFLKVNPMTIYRYLPNKEALYAAVLEAIMSEINTFAGDAGGATEDHLRQVARSFRGVLLKHQNAVAIIATQPIRTLEALRPIETILSFLITKGFPPEKASATINVCAQYVLGSVQVQIAFLSQAAKQGAGRPLRDALPEVVFPNVKKTAETLSQGYSMESEFEFGLNCIVRGILSTVPKTH